MEYASKAVGTAGLTTGIIGTALGALGGGLSMFGGMPRYNNGYGNYNGYDNGNCNHHEHYITRYESELQQEIARRDSELALIKSEQNTEVKIADVYERLITRINADKNEQQQINAQQAVYNGTNTAMFGCLNNQVAQLMSLTQLKIPNRSVCPGWGEVNVTPVTPTPTTAG